MTNEDILALLEGKDTAAKLDVVEKICVEYTAKKFKPDEIRLAEEIFRIVAKDAEVKMRANLSEALKEHEHLPHDIAHSLAKDVDEVASPMIEFSPALSEDDLLEIMSSNSFQKILSISRRKKLTNKLLSNLLSLSNDEITKNLLQNNELINDEKGFELAIEDIANNREAIKNLISVVTLPAKVTEKIMQETASDLIQSLSKKYNLDPAVFDRVAGHTVELSTLTLISEESSAAEIEGLIQHLIDFKRLTTSLIISSLCTCKMSFFISALAKRANLPAENVSIVLHKGGDEGLRKLLIKAELPEKLNSALQVVIKFVIEKKIKEPNLNQHEFCKELISKLEYYNDRTRIEYLNYLLAIAKQSLKAPDFFKTY